jgi:hypothetical protein
MAGPAQIRLVALLALAPSGVVPPSPLHQGTPSPPTQAYQELNHNPPVWALPGGPSAKRQLTCGANVCGVCSGPQPFVTQS